MRYRGLLTVTCGVKRVSIGFANRDWMLLADAISGRAELDRLMPMLGFGLETQLAVERRQLLVVCKLAIQVLEGQGNLLNYDYPIELPADGARPRIRGQCHIHGLRLNGAPHALYARNGQCWLERWEIDDEGTGRAVERSDLRRVTNFELDFGVELKIRRKWRGEPPWVRGLSQMVDLLEGCESRTVQIENPLR